MLKQLSLSLYQISRDNSWPILSALMVIGVIDQEVSRRRSEKIRKIEEIVEVMEFGELNKGRIVLLVSHIPVPELHSFQ